MKRLAFLMVALGLPVASAQSNTAPFGIPMGTTVAQLKKMGAVYDAEYGVYILTSPPVKNPNFEQYLVLASPRGGVCKIIGIGKDIITSSDGDDLRSAFSAMNNALNTKYGSATKKFDFLKVGSIWDEPEDFMMGLAVEDRHYDYYWIANEGAKLGNNISIIALSGTAKTSTKGYITVGYEYKNLSTCTNEQKTVDGKGL